jgi:hypothetical protein
MIFFPVPRTVVFGLPIEPFFLTSFQFCICFTLLLPIFSFYFSFFPFSFPLPPFSLPLFIFFWLGSEYFPTYRPVVRVYSGQIKNGFLFYSPGIVKSWNQIKQFINVRIHGTNWHILLSSIFKTSLRCLGIKMNRVFRSFFSHMEERSMMIGIPETIYKNTFFVKGCLNKFLKLPI